MERCSLTYGHLTVDGLQRPLPFEQLLRLLVRSPARLRAVSIDGDTVPEAVLLQCSQLPLQELELGSSSAHWRLRGAALPHLRTLLLGSLMPRVADDCSLHLAHVALPQVQQLRFMSGASSISLAHLSLPALTELTLCTVCSSGGTSILHCQLPAVTALRISTYGSVTLEHNRVPTLAALEVQGWAETGEQPSASLHLIDGALPALRTLGVSKASITLQRLSLPALPALQLTKVGPGSGGRLGPNLSRPGCCQSLQLLVQPGKASRPCLRAAHQLWSPALHASAFPVACRLHRCLVGAQRAWCCRSAWTGGPLSTHGLDGPPLVGNHCTLLPACIPA